MLPSMAERIVRIRVRTILMIFGLAIATWALLHIVSIARQVIVWVLIALFLALAINPLVELLQRRGLRRRGIATGVAILLVLLGIAAIGALFIPTLVDNVNKFVDAVPGYVDDLTKGKGRLGFLETKYHVVEKVREQVENGGAKKLLGLSGAAVAVTKSVISIVVGAITIIFLTFFMLLEGPVWVERFYGLLSPESQPRWRKVGTDIYRQIGGYVTGNLVISLIAGTLTTLVLLVLGVPFAVALGLIVAVLDLIPLAGATIAAIIIGTVAFLHSIVAGIVVIAFFMSTSRSRITSSSRSSTTGRSRSRRSRSSSRCSSERRSPACSARSRRSPSPARSRFCSSTSCARAASGRSRRRRSPSAAAGGAADDERRQDRTVATGAGLRGPAAVAHAGAGAYDARGRR